ncbi:Hypothetical protein NGAL_HAMBI1146_34020 [Neorhizobium galegae bv. officinalis]|nr:Hypothetical protein NGAL_HAMBI1146_34020 [Neorhizobium galegae bv. officinalis]
MPTFTGDFFMQFCRVGSCVPFDPPKISASVNDANDANRIIDDRVEGKPSLDHQHSGGLSDVGARRAHLGVVRQSRYASLDTLGNRIGHG